MTNLFSRSLSLSVLLSLTCLIGCSDDDGPTGPIPQTLTCPNPGPLPFDVEDDSFNSDDSALLAALPRNKDEASDIVGKTGGPYALTTLLPADATSATLSFDGKKARAQASDGLSPNGIVGEPVSLWVRDTDEFVSIGRTDTDDSGAYSLPSTTEPPRTVWSILEGDGTCAQHGTWVLPTGSKVIVADIDGTLTANDEEFIMQIGDGSHDPLQKANAQELIAAWTTKGYQIVYLTARPHTFRAETRAWLTQHQYPEGPVLTASALVFGETARMHKASWLGRLKTDFSWTIAAVYGNAGSDIQAYEDAGIPKDVTFIIGPEAGQADTVAIPNDDYGPHITEYVSAQPDA